MCALLTSLYRTLIRTTCEVLPKAPNAIIGAAELTRRLISTSPLLALVDTLRGGRARERPLAADLIRKHLSGTS